MSIEMHFRIEKLYFFEILQIVRSINFKAQDTPRGFMTSGLTRFAPHAV